MRAPILVIVALGVAAAGFAAPANQVADDGACLKCHGDPALSVVRNGSTLSLFVDPAKNSHSVHSSLGCTDCHDGLDAAKKPHHGPATPVDCAGCHDGISRSHAFHADFALAPLPKTAETDCVSCHGGHDVKEASGAKSAFAGEKLAAACAECHEDEVDRFRKSAHGLALAAGRGEAPGCITCHSHPISVGKDRLQLKREQYRLCLSCHRDSRKVLEDSAVSRGFIASYAESVHGLSLSHGNAKAANCVDCHGSHETAGALASGSRENQRNVPATCSKCHEEQAREYATSAHSAALVKGLPDAPVCTTCHGEHEILKPSDPRAAVSSRNVSQMVCGRCHASVTLAKRYGISSDQFQTFTDSYHGLSTRGGSVVAVNCASCHGAHGILPSSNPNSPINRNNLERTCGQCHPGADKRFTAAKVHASLGPDGQEPVVYWVATLYLWLIVAVVGGMVLHNGLDFAKKIRRKIAIQKGLLAEEPVPHRLYLRMTVNERLQHGTLVLSFVALVITGFMLQFPEAWWVLHIRHHVGHVFEWRGIIHRVAGIVLVSAGGWHFGYLAFTSRGRRLFLDLLPRTHDVTDAVGILRYNMGLSPSKPRFGRFSYIEKTEYWAMLWGSMVMGVTGAFLWFDNTSIALITRLGFDVSRTVHLYEAVLATLAIIAWHFYFVIFNPDIYPMNLSWLTGWLSEKEMIEDHPLELERLEEERLKETGPGALKPPENPGPGI